MVKNNSIHYYLVVLLLIIWTSSCNSTSSSQQQQESRENEIEFELVVLENKYNLDNRDDYPYCSLRISVLYPVISNIYDLENIQDHFQNSLIGSDYAGLQFSEAIEKYAQSYITSYKRDAEVYRVSKPKEGVERDYYNDGELSNMPEVFYSYHETITDSIIYNYNGILSYQITQTNNKGGNISYENIRNYVIDLSTGELLGEGEIFLAGYDTALRTIIQNELMVLHDVKYIEDLEDLGYFGIEEIIPNNNFLITNEGIVYTYNKGEYSAYQLPASDVLIPYTHIRSILREGSIADKLSKL